MRYRLKNRGICWFFSDEFVKFISTTTNLNSQKGQGVKQKKRFFLWCVKACLKTKRTKLKQQDLSKLVNPTDAQKEWQGSLPRSSSLGGVFDKVSHRNARPRFSHFKLAVSSFPPPPPPHPTPKLKKSNQSINENVCPKKKRLHSCPLISPLRGITGFNKCQLKFCTKEKTVRGETDFTFSSHRF